MAEGPPIDVHLMVRPVDRIVPDFAERRRDLHQLPPRGDRARRSHHRADPRARLQAGTGVQSGDAARLARLHARQARPGAADVGEPGLRRAEVHPERAARRSPRARRGSMRSGRAVRVEVDGGIKVENIGAIARAGADTFVAGSAIFGSEDYAPRSGPCARADRGRVDADWRALLVVVLVVSSSSSREAWRRPAGLVLAGR